MRFSRSAGRIDMDKTEREIMTAFRSGVNYYDTAYVYAGSEAALGEILERNHIREQVYIATKLPHYLIKTEDNMEKYFTEQLKRLRTDHVDYYLMHMLTDVQTWERLKGLGILRWLEEKKKSGAIRQVGFCSDPIQLYGRKFPGRTQRAQICQPKGSAGHHHGTAARRETGQQSAGRGEEIVCRLSDKAHTGTVGTALALEPAGSHLCAIRNEFRGNGTG